MALSDAQLAALDSIEHRLLALAEDLMLEEINETDYAFNVHDALANLPTPAAPAHLFVMKRATQWFTLQLITAEMKKGGGLT